MDEPRAGERTAALYAAATLEHFQHPRNVGRMADADAVGHVDHRPSDTTITLYLKWGPDGRIARASFRAFGCSACVAASSMITVLATGRSRAGASRISPERLDRALGGLPATKRYCADLAVQALTDALAQRPP